MAAAVSRCPLCIPFPPIPLSPNPEIYLMHSDLACMNSYELLRTSMNYTYAYLPLFPIPLRRDLLSWIESSVHVEEREVLTAIDGVRWSCSSVPIRRHR